MGGNTGDLIEIVDRNPEFRAVLRTFLEGNGFSVCEASNGQEGIDLFDRESPKLVLMSCDLPVINGVDACRRIREIDRDEYSPVIIITTKDDDSFITAVFAAGAADYITQPIRWRLLSHRIKYKLEMSKATYALEASEDRFRQLFEDSPLPYQSLNDHGEIVDVNSAWLDMMGYTAADVVGKSFGDFMPADEWRKFLHAFPGFIKSGTLSNFHLLVTGSCGQSFDIEMNGRVANDIHGHFKQTHVTLQNITERKMLEDKLTRLATTDPLTGLNNRRSFSKLAETERLKSIRFQHPFAVMMLDIDHFKAINDTYGHNSGDIVLKQVAAVMQQNLRDVDILGRLGGEEFAIVLPETAMQLATTIAERIRAAIAALTMDTDEGQISVTISIGVTALSDAQESNEALLHQADQLLYQAKQNGRNRVEQSEAGLNPESC